MDNCQPTLAVGQFRLEVDPDCSVVRVLLRKMEDAKRCAVWRNGGPKASSGQLALLTGVGANGAGPSTKVLLHHLAVLPGSLGLVERLVRGFDELKG